MKVLSLSTAEMDGGAAVAAFRIHQGLLALGVDAQMLVQVKTSDRPEVNGPQGKWGRGLSALRPTLDSLPQKIWAPKSRSQFSSQWVPEDIQARIQAIMPDVINLHWISKGFMRIETLKMLEKPIFWTLHDMWPLTGGCHHSGECERFQATCGSCPQLFSRREYDLSRWIWNRKNRAWHDVNLILISPSHWLANRAAQSSLLSGRRIEVIANGLDIERFRPVERDQARKWLGLPMDKKLILFSAIKPASNPYKGFNALKEFFQRLAGMGWQEQVEVVILGTSDPSTLGRLPFKAHFLGFLSDEVALALIYTAVDLFLAPSVQDNLPNTIMEAMACGTPSVAFRVGGIPDLIDHKGNGYLAEPGAIDDLAFGADWLLKDAGLLKQFACQARLKVERNFDALKQARRYLDLYEEILLTQGLKA